MKRLVRVRVSPSGQSRARLPLSQPSAEPIGQNQGDNPITTSRGRRMPVIPRTRSLSRDPLSPQGPRCFSGFFRARPPPRSERCRRSSPETTSRLRLPAGKPTAAPSPLPEPPCIPHLEPPAISIEQFRRMRHFFSIAEESPGLFRTFSGHVLTVVQINVQNRPACPAATQLERKSPPGRWLQAPRSASSPRQGACVHPSTHSTDPHRPMP